MKLALISSVGAMAASILSCADPGLRNYQDPDQALHEWQLQRLMDPSPRDLEKEHTGYVYIYDGLTQREVEAALETQFSRIQNMMFVGTVKTDASGKPLKDPDSGKYVQESGSCSN
jgi:hypothetical protein